MTLAGAHVYPASFEAVIAAAHNGADQASTQRAHLALAGDGDRFARCAEAAGASDAIDLVTVFCLAAQQAARSGDLPRLLAYLEGFARI